VFGHQDWLLNVVTLGNHVLPDHTSQTLADHVVNQHRSRSSLHCCVWILHVHTWRWLAVTHTNACMDWSIKCMRLLLSLPCKKQWLLCS